MENLVTSKWTLVTILSEKRVKSFQDHNYKTNVSLCTYTLQKIPSQSAVWATMQVAYMLRREGRWPLSHEKRLAQACPSKLEIGVTILENSHS